MALLTRAATASPDASTAMFVEHISGLVAGETIDAAAPCYIKASDGKVYMSNGTAADAAAKVDGFSAEPAKAGQGVTLLGRGLRIGQYGTGLTIGALYYLGTTAGRLDTATTTGGTVALAKAITTTDIRVVNIVP